jgi:squalene monooxygenase
VLINKTLHKTKDACQDEYDFLFVGFGPLGASLSSSLARSGRKVLVLERDVSPPQRIVGELLQPGGCAALRKLGLGEVLDDEDVEAQMSEGYQIILGRGERSVNIPYPDSQRGRSFHHGRFIHGIRTLAARNPSLTVVHATVNSLVRCPRTNRVTGVSATPANTSKPVEFSAKVTIVCDGCFSKFRRELAPRPPTVRSYFLGLILVDADLPAPRYGHVILPRKGKGVEIDEEQESDETTGLGPVLVYQLCKKETRMLIDIPGKVPSGPALKTYLEKRVAPFLPASLLPSLCVSGFREKEAEGEAADTRLSAWLQLDSH